MYVSNRCFTPFNLVLTYIACDYEMHVMLMLMLWDANACLTPRGITSLPPYKNLIPRL
jgi:hypothetical protein